MNTASTSAGAVAGRLANLQALRALAAVAVLLHNLAYVEKFRLGPLQVAPRGSSVLQAGVDIFFVLSGYLMIRTTLARPGGWRACADFLVARAVRIYPAYWAVLLPCAAIAAIAPAIITDGPHASLLASLTLAPASNPPLVHQGWTLVREVCFYGVVGLSLLAPPRLRPYVLLIWTLAIFLGFVVGLRGAGAGLQTLLSPLCLEFLLGCTIAYLPSLGREARLARTSLVLGLILLFAGGTELELGRLWPSAQELWRVLFAGVPAALIVHGAVGLEAGKVWTAPSWLVTLGERSYSLYLVNLPVALLSAAGWSLARASILTHAGYLLSALLLSAGAAELLHLTVERPSLARLRRRARTSPTRAVRNWTVGGQIP